MTSGDGGALPVGEAGPSDTRASLHPPRGESREGVVTELHAGLVAKAGPK